MFSIPFDARASFGLSRVKDRGHRRPPVAGAQPGLPAPSPAADWIWSPDLRMSTPPSGPIEPGATVLPGVTLHHDCASGRVRIRPLPDSGFRLMPEDFNGQFLSLALDLPSAALDGLRRHHIVGFAICISSLAPMSAYGRLNILHGPNSEVVLCTLRRAPHGPPDTHLVDFDLATTDLDEERLTRAWLDLIFDAPGDTALQINAIGLHRRPRAVL